MKVQSRVKIKTTTKEFDGVILKIGKITQILTDENKVVKLSKEQFGAFVFPSKKTLPKDSLANFKLEKGDFVEFNYQNEKKNGVVKKLKDAVMIVVNATDGMQYEIKGISATKKEQIIKEDPIMKDWTIKGYKVNEKLSNETLCFEATIYKNGKKVILAANRGTGGSTDYYPLGEEGRKIINEFEEKIKEWAQFYGLKQKFEIEDIWIAYKTEEEAMGISMEEFIKKQNDIYDDMEEFIKKQNDVYDELICNLKS